MFCVILAKADRLRIQQAAAVEKRQKQQQKQQSDNEENDQSNKKASEVSESVINTSSKKDESASNDVGPMEAPSTSAQFAQDEKGHTYVVWQGVNGTGMIPISEYKQLVMQQQQHQQQKRQIEQFQQFQQFQQRSSMNQVSVNPFRDESQNNNSHSHSQQYAQPIRQVASPIVPSNVNSMSNVNNVSLGNVNDSSTHQSSYKNVNNEGMFTNRDVCEMDSTSQYEHFAKRVESTIYQRQPESRVKLHRLNNFIVANSRIVNQNNVATVLIPRELDDKDKPPGFDQWLHDDHAKSTKAPEPGDVWIHPFYRTGKYCYNHDLSTRSQPRKNNSETTVTTAGKGNTRQNVAENTKSKKTAKETDSTDTPEDETNSPTTSTSPTDKCTKSKTSVQSTSKSESAPQTSAAFVGKMGKYRDDEMKDFGESLTIEADHTKTKNSCSKIPTPLDGIFVNATSPCLGKWKLLNYEQWNKATGVIGQEITLVGGIESKFVPIPDPQFTGPKSQIPSGYKWKDSYENGGHASINVKTDKENDKNKYKSMYGGINMASIRKLKILIQDSNNNKLNQYLTHEYLDDRNGIWTEENVIKTAGKGYTELSPKGRKVFLKIVQCLHHYWSLLLYFNGLHLLQHKFFATFLQGITLTWINEQPLLRCGGGYILPPNLEVTNESSKDLIHVAGTKLRFCV